MRKILFLLLVILAVPLISRAQSTVTSGTIKDANGQAFVSGTYRIEFNANGRNAPFAWNGAPFDPTQYIFTGGLDSTGSFSGISIPSSNFISPSGTAWRFTVCPAASSPCYSTNISIQNPTDDVSTQITPPPIAVAGQSYNIPVAYSDAEIAGPKVGFQYYNLIQNTGRQCTIALPCTWVTLGSGSVLSFSSGNLSPLFTTSVTSPTQSPSLAFTLTNAAANSVFANCTNSLAAPSYCSLTVAMLPTGIPNANLQNPSITVNGVLCTLGFSCSAGVTSVAQTVPSWLTVGGSPVTSSGTLAITPAIGQTSGQVIGTCGSATTFGPCVLTAGDLPALRTVQAYNNCAMSGNLSVTTTVVQNVVSCAVTMPSSGCPCRIQYNWSVGVTVSNNNHIDFWVTDGTNNFRHSPVFGQTSDATGSSGSGTTSVTYSNSVVVTMTLQTQGLGSPSYTVVAAPFVGSGANSGMDVSAVTSN